MGGRNSRDVGPSGSRWTTSVWPSDEGPGARVAASELRTTEAGPADGQQTHRLQSGGHVPSSPSPEQGTSQPSSSAAVCASPESSACTLGDHPRARKAQVQQRRTTVRRQRFTAGRYRQDLRSATTGPSRPERDWREPCNVSSSATPRAVRGARSCIRGQSNLISATCRSCGDSRRTRMVRSQLESSGIRVSCVLGVSRLASFHADGGRGGWAAATGRCL